MEPGINDAMEKAISEAINHNLFAQSSITSLIVLIALLGLRYTLVRIERGKTETLMKELQKITEPYCAPFRDEAVKFNKRIEKKAAA